jgi:hypothetical protein
MALGLTQPVTEMSTRNLPGGKWQPTLKPDNLTANCEPIVYKMCETQSLETLWTSMAYYRDGFTLPYKKICPEMSANLCYTQGGCNLLLTVR